MSAAPHLFVRDCLYCNGRGCEECDGTGKKYRYNGVTPDGLTYSVSGSGDGPTPETIAAFNELVSAAVARAAGDPE